jgi:hypothetical protein
MRAASRFALVAALAAGACRSGDAPAGGAEADGAAPRAPLLSRVLAAATPPIERPEVTRSDSGGVRILTMSHVPPADDPDWEWELRVIRSIPTVGPDGEPIVFAPQGLTRLTDGRIVIVDSGEPVLAVIEPGAETVAMRFGREGQGPEELWGGVLVIWALGDGGIAVADPPSHKVLHFARDGEFVAGVATPAGVTGDRAAWQQAERTGELFAANVAFFQHGEGWRRVDSVVAFVPGADPPRPVAAFPEQPVDGRVTWPAVLNWWIVLPSGDVVTYRSDRADFRVSSAGGGVTEIRLPLSRAPMSAEEMAEVARFQRERVAPSLSPGGTSAQPIKTIGNGLEPFGDSAFVLRQYSLSTPLGDPENDGTVWRVIGIEGDYRGVIRFPRNFSAAWTDGADVVGWQADSLGVATIQELTLEPPPALR